MKSTCRAYARGSSTNLAEELFSLHEQYRTHLPSANNLAFTVSMEEVRRVAERARVNPRKVSGPDVSNGPLLMRNYTDQLAEVFTPIFNLSNLPPLFRSQRRHLPAASMITDLWLSLPQWVMKYFERLLLKHSKSALLVDHHRFTCRVNRLTPSSQPSILC